MSKLFLITGVSSGFGEAFAQAALDAGHKVVGTFRKEEQRAAFDQKKPGHSFGRLLDVTEIASINPLVAEIEQNVGAIDVLINNAGYGHEGIFEESTFEDLRTQFEVNVFGPVALMQAVLPFMRKRRAGYIFNVTSMGGFITMPGISYYHGSKFALEGISETVGKEVKDLGIHVTAIEPGSFRTDWAGRSMVRAPRTIGDYDAVFDPIRKRRQEYSGNQIGNPKKAAEVVLKLVESNNPPAHMLLGSDALKLVSEKLTSLQKEIADWKELTLSTDFT